MEAIRRAAAGAAIAVALATPVPSGDAPGGASVVRPVGGAVVEPFAPPDGPYGAGHRGVDLAATPGEPVRAALAGTVAFAGPVAGARWVTLDHGGGLETTYGVFAELAVAEGAAVEAGQVLGVLAPGRAHLDWGARLHGAYVDPLALLGRWEAHLIDPARFSERPASFARAPALRAPPRAPGTGAGALTWPLAGRVTSGFGPRTHPVHGGQRLHAGVDVAAPSGAPVVAAADGVVRVAGRQGGYGLVVIVDHGGGLETRYAHASVLEVRAGQPVARGQLVARVGATGTATGPHLHFEVRTGGAPRDPLGFYP